MPERPFICTTAATLYDEGLNSVSEGAALLWNNIQKCTDRYGRFSANPAIIMGECMAMRIKDWPLERVLACLNELAAAGCLRFCERGGKRWVQLAEHLMYREGLTHEPRWSPPDEVATQQELNMPVALNVPGQKPSRAQTRILKREEDNKRKTQNDSPREAAFKIVNNPPAPAAADDSETRAVSAGDGEKAPELPRLVLDLPPDEPAQEPKPRHRGTRSEKDKMLARLGTLAGHKESVENAGSWVDRWKANPFAMNEALGQLSLRLAPAMIAKEGKLENRGAWLTDRYEVFAGLKEERKRA